MCVHFSLQCYLVLMVVGLAYALPAEIAAKKEEAAVLTPEKNEQAKLIPALKPQDLAAGAVADAALKPDDKKEGLESSETIWGLGWGGYGRGTITYNILSYPYLTYSLVIRLGRRIWRRLGRWLWWIPRRYVLIVFQSFVLNYGKIWNRSLFCS